MKSVLTYILTIIVCVVLIFTGIYWLFAVLLSLLSFIIFKFLFYDRNDELKKTYIKNVFGTTEYKIKTLLNYGKSKILEIRRIRSEISNKDVKIKLQRIIDICELILDELKKKPGVVTKLRRFFNYNLESTVRIIKKYNNIVDYGKKSYKIKETISRTEAALDFIADNFEMLYDRIQNDSAEDIDLDIEILNKSFNSEIHNLNQKRKEM